VLGLTLDDKLMGLLGPLRTRAGVVVAAVSPDGPFWQEPVVPGDVIISANRQSVTTVEGLRLLLQPLKPGDPLVLQVERKNQLVFLAVEIE
jgi:S1-C subfamily serine protease